jgi:hypothetical protein
MCKSGIRFFLLPSDRIAGAKTSAATATATSAPTKVVLKNSLALPTTRQVKAAHRFPWRPDASFPHGCLSDYTDIHTATRPAYFLGNALHYFIRTKKSAECFATKRSSSKWLFDPVSLEAKSPEFLHGLLTGAALMMSAETRAKLLAIELPVGKDDVMAVLSRKLAPLLPK